MLSTPEKPLTCSCPSPELSVDERRQSYADALLETASMYYGVAKFETEGIVRQFTKIRKRGAIVEMIDGWVRVENPSINPDLCIDECTEPDVRDLLLSVPSVCYGVEVDVGDGRKCALTFSLRAGQSDFLPNRQATVGLFICPSNGNKWRNYDYASDVRLTSHAIPPSCTKLINYPLSELTGCEMRDMLKIAALLNYFKCTDFSRLEAYNFVTGSGFKLSVTVRYLRESCVIDKYHLLNRIGLGPPPLTIDTLKEIMDWAESMK